jgi:hypothetical protein
MFSIPELEALCGTSPSFSERNEWRYLAYHTSVVEFNVTETTGDFIKASRKEITTKLQNLLLNVLQITVLFSVLHEYSYCLFPKREIETALDLLYWGNICNNYALACTCLLSSSLYALVYDGD